MAHILHFPIMIPHDMREGCLERAMSEVNRSDEKIMDRLLLDRDGRYLRSFYGGVTKPATVCPSITPFPGDYGDFYAVEGGRHLEGRIRPAGNKNAALPCLAATLLSEGPVTLRNVPRILDVLTFLDILTALGSEVSWIGRNELIVDTRGVKTSVVERELVS